MGLDKRLLDILCDPVSKVPVHVLNARQLDLLNAAIDRGEAQTVGGETLKARLKAGLITQDGKVIYRIDDDIPVMLPEEGIGTTQLKDWTA